MALEEEFQIKGVAAKYHRVIGLIVDTLDRANPMISVTVAFYADKSQRDGERAPTENALGRLRIHYGRSGVVWEGDGIPWAELTDPASKAAVEAFILEHLPETYGVLKLIPIYQNAKDV